MLRKVSFRNIAFRNLFAFSNRTAGNLYTWGIASMGSGINQETQKDQLVPRRVEEFRGNVVKVVTGENSTAVITSNGDLYTFGANCHGQLGIGNKQDTLTPQLVEFFKQNGLRVEDVALGSKHAIALTHDGGIWTWGSCAMSRVPFLNKFFPAASGLGYHTTQDQFVPNQVDFFKGKPKAKFITAGTQFSLMLDESGQMWGWGQGTLGQFGNGYIENLVYPELNPLWQEQTSHHNSKVVKIKSVGDGTIVLLDCGTLLGWGGNNFGQLGIREKEFIRSDGYNVAPLLVNQKYMQPGEKVVDFDLGIDNLVFYTDKNNVYFSGNDDVYVPYHINKPVHDQKVVKVVGGEFAYSFLVDNGDLWMTTDFVQPYEEIHNSYLIRKPKKELFNGAPILDIGGAYKVRYAIVQE